MVIVAIGLMGFAAMMVQSMKNNRIAMERSVATFYAYDIIDCMRVNRQAALTGGYTLTNFGDVKTGTGVATNDVNIWQAALSTSLPGGAGKITILPSNIVKIEIQWTGASQPWKTESTL
jgi:type IV pilus assembly protein PilV